MNKFIGALLAVLLFSGLARAEKPVITFTTPTQLESAAARFFEDLYSEAFGRLGYGFKLLPRPTKRSLKDAESGEADGETARIDDPALEKQFPDLIRVDEPVGSMTLIVYTIDGPLRFDGWEDLSLLGKDDLVGYPRGILAIEQHAREFGHARVYITNSALQGCRMLTAGRLDYIISPRSLLRKLCSGSQGCDYSRLVEAGVLERIPTYPYLHRRHAALAPELARVLREMKADGAYRRIIQKWEKPSD
ncbi:substrate-binding periplasmic protein [Salidesulfovibrio onnuriiensis]|uniref:substrate-binding periplasmic protein n=1 Tax=Salidesulfovibrio onnuriiensis TaxID=2583823 RepID=UPI0011C74846|nr:transporter substrate-binding domain-containing protein [Salidesulfovibrio onnuriiensis]